MTVGIAAITRDENHIVVAGDRMLSHGDIIQAADDAALKASRITKKWGATFAGEANRFLPIMTRTIRHLPQDDSNCTKDEIRDALLLAYREEFEQLVASNYLARIGYSNVSDFMNRGLKELGDTAFQNTLRKIETADLGITILVFGFDEIRSPSIFQISNPGVFVDHGLLGCAAIGSGVYMATAAMRRRPPTGDLETVIYRLLDAKFSSETATGVGRATTLLIANANGKVFFLNDTFIEKIRSAWLKLSQQPDPKSAMNLLRMAKFTNVVQKFGTDGDEPDKKDTDD